MAWPIVQLPTAASDLSIGEGPATFAVPGIRLHTVTWNMHGKLPAADGLSVLFPTAHIYAIGSEECERSIGASMVIASKQAWVGRISAVLGPAYAKVASHTLAAIHLVVFAHVSVLPLISNVQTGSVACGVGNALGNKGGVAVGFSLGSTGILVVNCHLAAHSRAVARRNADAARIDAQLRLNPVVGSGMGRQASSPAADDDQQQDGGGAAADGLSTSDDVSGALNDTTQQTGAGSAVSPASSSPASPDTLSSSPGDPGSATTRPSCATTVPMGATAAPAVAGGDEAGDREGYGDYDSDDDDDDGPAPDDSVLAAYATADGHSDSDADEGAGSGASSASSARAAVRAQVVVDGYRYSSRAGSRRASVQAPDGPGPCQGPGDPTRTGAVAGISGRIAGGTGEGGGGGTRAGSSGPLTSPTSSGQPSSGAIDPTMGMPGPSINGYNDPTKGMPGVTSRYDRVVWMGDLNYRINGSRKVVDAALEGGMHEVLLANDQLLKERRAGRALAGFHEGPIGFRPTYKLDKGTLVYDSGPKARVPSWTDRILFRSNEPGVITYGRYEYPTAASSLQVHGQTAGARRASMVQEGPASSAVAGATVASVQNGKPEGAAEGPLGSPTAGQATVTAGSRDLSLGPGPPPVVAAPGMTLVSYTSHESLRTSDHLPVTATFDIKLKGSADQGRRRSSVSGPVGQKGGALSLPLPKTSNNSDGADVSTPRPTLTSLGPSGPIDATAVPQEHGTGSLAGAGSAGRPQPGPVLTTGKPPPSASGTSSPPGTGSIGGISSPSYSSLGHAGMGGNSSPTNAASGQQAQAGMGIAMSVGTSNPRVAVGPGPVPGLLLSPVTVSGSASQYAGSSYLFSVSTGTSIAGTATSVTGAAVESRAGLGAEDASPRLLMTVGPVRHVDGLPPVRSGVRSRAESSTNGAASAPWVGPNAGQGLVGVSSAHGTIGGGVDSRASLAVSSVSSVGTSDASTRAAVTGIATDAATTVTTVRGSATTNSGTTHASYYTDTMVTNTNTALAAVTMPAAMTSDGQGPRGGVTVGNGAGGAGAVMTAGDWPYSGSVDSYKAPPAHHISASNDGDGEGEREVEASPREAGAGGGATEAVSHSGSSASASAGASQPAHARSEPANRAVVPPGRAKAKPQGVPEATGVGCFGLCSPTRTSAVEGTKAKPKTTPGQGRGKASAKVAPLSAGK